MTRHSAPYLAALKSTLGSAILPVVPAGMPQQLAMCAQRLLAGLYCDAHHSPPLRAKARSEYSSLLAAVRDALGESPAARELEAGLLEGGDFDTLQTAVQTVIAALSESENPTNARLIGKLVSVEGQQHRAYLSALESELSAEPGDRERSGWSDAQTRDLEAYLRSVFRSAPRLEIVGTRVVPGGFSKQTVFVELRNQADLSNTLVVRVDKADSPVGSTVVDEFAVIETLFRHGVPVPQPFALEATGKVLGSPFVVVGRAAGGNAGDALDVANRSRALAEHLAQAVAKLHLVPQAEFGPDVAGSNTPTRERLLGEIQGFENQWRAMQQPSVALEGAFAWLKSHLHLADGLRSLVHKDIGCHNFVAENDAVTAILDWETAVIGNPAQDLGYLRKTVVQMTDWQNFMDAYAAAGAPVPPPEQVDYYEVWGYTWLNVMLGSARFGFETGATDDLQLGYAGMHLAARLRAQLNDALLDLVFR